MKTGTHTQVPVPMTVWEFLVSLDSFSTVPCEFMKYLSFQHLFIMILFPIQNVDTFLGLPGQQTTVEVEVALGAVSIDGADDRLDGVRIATLVGVVAIAEHRGEAESTAGTR